MAVKEIREFDRFYTNFIGALDYGKQLYTPFTLTEARVLYELAHARGPTRRTCGRSCHSTPGTSAGYWRGSRRGSWSPAGRPRTTPGGSG